MNLFHLHYDEYKYLETLTLSLSVTSEQGQPALTLNLLNYLNGIIHLPFLGLSIIIIRNIKMRT